jgi:hypothetical protein
LSPRQSYCCYGVVGFDFEPPCVTVYHFTWVWARYTIGVCVFGYDGYYAKGLALRLIAISWLYFISTLLGLIGENREGYALRVLGVIYWPVRDLCSSVHNLSCLLNSLLVLQSYG